MLELLSTIYNSQVPIGMQRLSDTDRRVLAENVQKQAKSSRIEEWKSLPLNTDEERLSWWSKRQELIRKGIEAGSSHASHESPAQTEPWVMESSPVVAHYEDVRSSVVDGSTLPFAQQPQLAQATWQLAPDVLGVPEPAPGPLHQDQDMLDMSPRGNLGNEAYLTGDGRSEPLAPSVSGTSLDSRPSTTEQWRKYF
ncbi:hypothetical protein BKA58DRAFT_375792 [Alternaria rosae]|uniref:uncharacterized protein n=1 Tax=Alternaria rosae TaxID=1187941 RepID=UPI001E8E4D19|nr:uncharacterized protein BKA58DRAFT_375792 [Alternaria rosae]KAH6877715.1 hypothetical protein BKA58DRAFT_375792 [Alternaria rosae]